ncbi:TetR/AcrR family transcriptional regulator [Rathayibacter sp. CAU 1779]
MAERMRGDARRAQVLEIAAREFAERGLSGASVETIAREADITQAYVFRMFGTKKALFLELVTAAFDRVSDGMLLAGDGLTGTESLARMGAQYYDLLADRTALLLQLQGFAACGDPEVQAVVRERLARMWQVVADTTGLDAVTVKSFLAFGMLLNAGAAVDVAAIDEPWADGIRTLVKPGLFDHITAETNR